MKIRYNKNKGERIAVLSLKSPEMHLSAIMIIKIIISAFSVILIFTSYHLLS